MSLSFFHLSTDRDMFTCITACFCQFKHNTWAVKAAVSVVCLIHAQLSDMTSITVPPEDCLRTEPGGAARFSLVWSFFLRSRHDIIVIRFPNSCRNPVALEWTMDIAASAALQTSCAWWWGFLCGQIQSCVVSALVSLSAIFHHPGCSEEPGTAPFKRGRV